jgi:hypothetical protein
MGIIDGNEYFEQCEMAGEEASSAESREELVDHLETAKMSS